MKKKRYSIFANNTHLKIALFFSEPIIKCVILQLYSPNEPYNKLVNNYYIIDEIILFQYGKYIEENYVKMKDYMPFIIKTKNTLNTYLISRYITRIDMNRVKMLQIPFSVKIHTQDDEDEDITKYTHKSYGLAMLRIVTNAMETLFLLLQIPHDQPTSTIGYGQGLYDADTYISFYEVGFVKRMNEYCVEPTSDYLYDDRNMNSHTLQIQFAYDYMSEKDIGLSNLLIDDKIIATFERNCYTLQLTHIIRQVVQYLCYMYQNSQTNILFDLISRNMTELILPYEVIYDTFIV